MYDAAPGVNFVRDKRRKCYRIEHPNSCYYSGGFQHCDCYFSGENCHCCGKMQEPNSPEHSETITISD